MSVANDQAHPPQCLRASLRLGEMLLGVGEKLLEDLAYHLSVVGVGFVVQLFMEFERESFRTAPAA
jgi:hypothetical protein